VFHGTGASKASARFNAAQTAMNVVGPKVYAELERRKTEKLQKVEEKKAERAERLKQKHESETQEGEGGNVSMETSNGDTSDGNASGNTAAVKLEATVAAGEGSGDDKETPSKVKAIGSLRVLKDIRPGTSCGEKLLPNALAGYHAAQVVIDGYEFIGHGDSLSKAKAVAAASGLTSLFNLSFTYSPRKNMAVCYLLIVTANSLNGY